LVFFCLQRNGAPMRSGFSRGRSASRMSEQAS
jgi:hypothetical protein